MSQRDQREKYHHLYSFLSLPGKRGDDVVMFVGIKIDENKSMSAESEMLFLENVDKKASSSISSSTQQQLLSKNEGERQRDK